MKKIIVMLTIAFITTCKAQSIVYVLGENNPTSKPAGCYIQDSNNLLNRFAGTWIYNQNGQYFKIVLTKVLQRPFSDIYVDDILGNFFYKVNNIVVADTQSLIGDQSPMYIYRIFTDVNKITLIFKDPARKKMGSKVEITYSATSNGVEKLYWHLYSTGNGPILPRESTANQFDFRVPINLVLTKQ